MLGRQVADSKYQSMESLNRATLAQRSTELPMSPRESAGRRRNEAGTDQDQQLSTQPSAAAGEAVWIEEESCHTELGPH
jgi:hypothetical protein